MVATNLITASRTVVKFSQPQKMVYISFGEGIHPKGSSVKKDFGKSHPRLSTRLGLIFHNEISNHVVSLVENKG